MAESKKSSAPAEKKPEPAPKKGPAAAAKPEPKAATKAPAQPKPAAASKPAAKPSAAKSKETPKAAAKKPPTKAPAEEKVKIVEKTTPTYVAQAKPTLTPEQKAGLALRRTVDARRPRFRRQQWYEYKRLADSGWRKPTGIDSAMRRHFGYEQSVVRIGFGGPKNVRGLHPSGFQEVYVANVGDLKAIDKKTQAARVSGTLGARKLKLVYAEADKLGIRILNRRNLE